MSERSLWDTVRKNLGRYPIDLQRHEDKLSKGIPDVSFGAFGVNGWIELKYIDKAGSGLLSCPHFTGEQRRWILDRGERGGNVFMLLQVGREYLLLGHRECQYVGQASLEQLRKYSLAVWEGSIDYPDFVELITAPSEAREAHRSARG